MKYLLFVPVLVIGLAAGAVVTSGASPDQPRAVVAVTAAETPAAPETPAVEPTAAAVPAATEVALEAPPPAAASVPVMPVEDPNVDRTLVPVPAPAPSGPTSICRIVHYGDDQLDVWGAYGVTGFPVGTPVVFTLTVDGQTHMVPLTVREGSVMVDEKSYGSDYAPGATVFGSTQENIVYLHGPHGPVSASVTIAGGTVCSV